MRPTACGPRHAQPEPDGRAVAASYVRVIAQDTLNPP